MPLKVRTRGVFGFKGLGSRDPCLGLQSSPLPGIKETRCKKGLGIYFESRESHGLSQVFLQDKDFRISQRKVSYFPWPKAQMPSSPVNNLQI